MWKRRGWRGRCERGARGGWRAWICPRRTWRNGALCRRRVDPGDEVLIAQPSYPLCDFLAQIDDVRLVPYPLVYDHGWQIDFGGLRERVTARTKAIVLVHPNNPTGHFTKDGERKEL